MMSGDAGNTELAQHRRVQLDYLPGLDGLRALAVLSVLVYHAGYPLAGGFLGVESFFVISGFLITALLLAEWQQHGGIDLRSFWLRRARRLLPALFAVLIATLLACAIRFPTELRALGVEMLAALLYVMNWQLVLGGQSYFDPLGRPSLLQHLWSLAVEEQFYLVWPVLFAFGMRIFRAGGFLFATILAAGASTLLMIGLYGADGDLSRIYYGTDTRAAGLLIGAALALVWTPARRAQGGQHLGLLVDIAGLAALVELLAVYAVLYDQHPLLYQGGFQLVALLTAAVIIAATASGTRALPWLLELRPMRWIGTRSYGLYLWHWPLFVLLPAGNTAPAHGWLFDLLRFGLTFVLAAASYRFIEQPVRKLGFGGALHTLRSATVYQFGIGAIRRRPAAAACVLLAIIVGAVPLSLRPISAAPPVAALPAPEAATALVSRPAPVGSPAPVAEVAPRATNTPSADLELEQDLALSEANRPVARPVPQITPTVPALPALDPTLIADLQALLDSTVANGFVPGAVASVSLPGYAPWVGASGLAERQQGQAMTPETIVRVASVSKMFTAVVVMQLVEEGVLSLDAPVSTWLPDSLPAADAISVRQLLQHTSGLYDFLEDRNLLGQMQREQGREWVPEELVAYAARFPSTSRGRWDYSSTNYVLLGMIVEQATGQSLAEQMRTRIFDPLGLQHTFFLPQEQIVGTLAHSYSSTVDLTGLSTSFAFGTGNIASTAADLEHFGRALFAGELLQAESRAQMLQYVSGRGHYGMPNLAYGLGVMYNRLPIGPGANGQRSSEENEVLGHIGGYGGFRAALWYAPESQIIIAISLNQAQADPNELAAAVLDRVLLQLGR
ncbi:MAG: serine hydrolase [Roseiflexaceae bacterium]|nr:serine hydrolase [Roseiflexaceae bacterium]